MTAAAFLDRDGVLIATEVREGRPYAVLSSDDVVVLPGVEEGLSRLKSAGLMTIVVTNQPDVARGLVSRAEVDAIHERLMDTLPIDAIRACFEVDGPDARCYKPLPTMLVDSAGEFGVDLSASYMVGDRWRDVGAGQAAGCRTVFIDWGYREALMHEPDWTVRSFGEAVTTILEHRGRGPVDRGVSDGS